MPPRWDTTAKVALKIYSDILALSYISFATECLFVPRFPKTTSAKRYHSETEKWPSFEAEFSEDLLRPHMLVVGRLNVASNRLSKFLCYFTKRYFLLNLIGNRKKVSSFIKDFSWKSLLVLCKFNFYLWWNQFKYLLRIQRFIFEYDSENWKLTLNFIMNYYSTFSKILKQLHGEIF